MQLAVIIVTWNVHDLVIDALRTLTDDLATTALDVEIIVVDSASSDDTVAQVEAHFPQVTTIACEENIGFGRANNVGMRHLGFGDARHTPDADLPEAVYLLNPDTLTQPDATKALYDALFAAPDLGVVGARLTYGDGSFQHSSFGFPGLRQLWVEFFPAPGRFIEGRFNGRYPREDYDGDAPFDVDFMLGATMMLRREVIQEVGMFDEQFFMYGEEVDWQWRIRDAGWRIQCVPAAQVVHLVGKSTGQVKARSVRNLWESRLYLFEKHYPAWKFAIARRMIALGMERKIAACDDPELCRAYAAIREQALSS